MFKRCCGCKKELPFSNFHKGGKSTKYGLQSRCKVCVNTPEIKEFKKRYASSEKGKISQRKSDLKRNYSITIEIYNKLLKEQNNKCSICGDESNGFDSKNNKPRNLAVDHDHCTGKIRGLLCTSCNRGLGFFKDNIILLIKAKNYLLIKR